MKRSEERRVGKGWSTRRARHSKRRRRHTRSKRDWSSDVCSSDLDLKIDSNRVEALVLEKSGPRLFCNITGQNAVGVFDRNKGSHLATWPLPPGDKTNVAMAFDEEIGRASCRERVEHAEGQAQ